jgi:nitrogen fixation protein NifB
VNAEHVPAIARQLAPLGVDLMNLVPLIPVPGTPLGTYPAPSASLLARLRLQAGVHIPQMRHCARCRADAAGLLGEPAPAAAALVPESPEVMPCKISSNR